MKQKIYTITTGANINFQPPQDNKDEYDELIWYPTICFTRG